MRITTILIFFFSSQLLATDFDVPAAKYDSIGLPDSSSGYECDIYMSEFRWEENYGPSFMLNAHTKNRDEFTSVRASKTRIDDKLFFMYQNGSTVLGDSKYTFFYTPYKKALKVTIGLKPLESKISMFSYYAKVDDDTYASGYVINPELKDYGYSIDISSMKGSYECTPL